MESLNLGALPTTKDRVRVVLPNDRHFGQLGTIVSGESERILYRILMDHCNALNHPEYRYLMSCEFEVVKRAAKT